MLETNGTLKIANVGDCGLRAIRGGAVAYSSFVLVAILFLPFFSFKIEVTLIICSTFRPNNFFHISTRTLFRLSLPAELRSGWANIP